MVRLARFFAFLALFLAAAPGDGEDAPIRGYEKDSKVR